jgi:Concanavalin A-like lectin/glucanases superfamily
MATRLQLAVLLPVLGALGCVGAPERCNQCGVGLVPDAGSDHGAADHTMVSTGGAGGNGAGGSEGGSIGSGGSGGSGTGGGGDGGGGGTAGAGGSTGGSGGSPTGDAGPPDTGAPDTSAPKDAAMEAAPEVPPQVLPLAFYPFDQTSGTTALDTSGNGHNATLIGGATFGTGQVRNDLSLNGTTGYLDLPDHMLDTATEVTIAAWVRVRTDRVWSRVFDFGNSANVNMFLTTHAGTINAVRFAITTTGNAGEQHLDGTAVLPAGTWRHVAVVLGAAGGALYVDGALVTTNAAMTLRPADLGAPVNNWVGRSQYAADPFLDGEVDEFRIYDRALAASDITTIFNAR